MMTVVIQSDHVMYLSALNMRSDWVLFSNCHFLTDDSLHSAGKVQQESRAVAGKLHVRCRRKIRYVSKFTSTSRGSRCDSTAFLLLFDNVDGKQEPSDHNSIPTRDILNTSL